VLFITSGLAKVGLTTQVSSAAWDELSRGVWLTFAKLNIWKKNLLIKIINEI